jgi:Ricin-type beta-trefoil lectin domain-like
MSQFMLVSAINGDVIDIRDNSTASGAPVQIYPSKASGINLNHPGVQTLAPNQTWEIKPDPAGSDNHVIQNPATGHCLDIEQASLSPGAAIDAFEVKSKENANQLWAFLPDPDGSGYYFIVNPQTGYVIEPQGGSPNSRTGLVVNPRRLFENKYQLWAASDGTALPALTLAPTSGTLQGNGNYVWMPEDQTKVLEDFTVEMVILENLVSPAFSVQLNGNAPYPPPKGVVYDAQWSQFGMAVQNNSLVLFQQVWHQLGAGPGGAKDPLETQTTFSGSFLTIQNNTIPAGTRIELKLVSNPSDKNITGITDQAFDKAGAALGPLVSWSAIGQPNFKGTTAPESALSPLAAIQVVICGTPGNNGHFTAGMGVLRIKSSTPLSAQTSVPNPHGIGTAENTNCYYGQVATGRHSLITQPFGLPNPRVTKLEGVWTFSGAGFLPNSPLTLSGEWTQDSPLLGAGKVQPNSLAKTQSDGTFSVLAQIGNDNAPYASGRLQITFTDNGGNSATGLVTTPLTLNTTVSSSGALGPP